MALEFILANENKVIFREKWIMSFEITTMVKHTRVYALNMKYATKQFGLPFYMNNTNSQYQT